ncbi:MAG TPA: TIGR00730 family Rossman fold protein [Casimicrobiaceae bacterium]|nr:TIGR00730 family Rossman fold protein [Casimicrobiaceae bacterium]
MKTPALDHVCVFCGANTGNRPAYAEAARLLGRTLAAHGITLIYGGGGIGLMYEAARATVEAGGRVIGIITEALMAREVGNRNVTELHVVQTMHERKAMMAERADAFVVLPGGYGTFDETCEMLTWNQLGILATPVVMVNLEGFFDGFLAQLERALVDGVLKPQHRAMLVVVTEVDAVLPAIRAWHAPRAAVPSAVKP